MKKIILASILLFAMFTNLNAIEIPSDSNCTVKKCKIEKTNDKNCTVEKCKVIKSSDKNCTTAKCKTEKADTDKKSPTWSATKGTNFGTKAPACCKGKRKEEAKEEKPAMKCAAGKCGSK
ncbi:MAG TPA: hypothetical protein EYG94_04030 [Campylobacterales bacterium]|nr:hypothetical protein [Campylobacterales bacterium]